MTADPCSISIDWEIEKSSDEETNISFIEISSLTWTETLPCLISPWIRIHVCEYDSGQCLWTEGELGQNSAALHTCTRPISNPNSFLFTWNESILIPVSYERLLNPSTFIIFEVLDAQISCSWNDSKSINNNLDQSLEQSEPLLLQLHQYNHHDSCLAWATYKPVETLHTSRDNVDYVQPIKLQLQRYRRETASYRCPCNQSHDNTYIIPKHAPLVFSQCLQPGTNTMNSYLLIRVGSSNKSPELVGAGITYKQVPPPDVMFDPSPIYNQSWQFTMSGVKVTTETPAKRNCDPGHDFPDNLNSWLPTATPGISTHGADVIQFSDCGQLVAVAVSSTTPLFSAGTYFYQLSIYRVSDGQRVRLITTIHHDIITDISWYKDDDKSYLLVSGSLDGTIQVHSFCSMDLSENDLTWKLENVLVHSTRNLQVDYFNNYHNFFYPDYPGKPRCVMFLGSCLVERKLSESSGKKSRLLLCGCTNATVALWDINSNGYESLGLIGEKNSIVYHETEITSFCKSSLAFGSTNKVDDDDRITFYSGDASGCIICWRLHENEAKISSQSFLPMFHVNGRGNNIAELKASEIVQILDCSGIEQNDSLLMILSKDAIEGSLKVLLYNYKTSYVCEMFRLECEKTFEHVVCASIHSCNGHSYIVGGSNIGRLYLWNCHQGNRMRSVLASINISYPITSLTWNPMSHTIAWSFDHVDGAVILNDLML